MKGPAHYQTLEYARVERLFRDFAARSAKPLRVLDYGCGRGKYLRCFRDLGLDVAGADMNPAYIAEGRGAGFAVYSPDELFDGNDRQYDVVFLSHLVEHLTPDELVEMVPRLCAMLAPGGRLIMITPLFGERFYHDFSHVRPYYPQSIRHAFGQMTSELSLGASRLIELEDIYFFKDPYRTRTWRSFYVSTGVRGALTRALNRLFDLSWRASAGRIGAKASWLGIYRMLDR
jgi:SAM-dependent methyltransferase